jgi:hypothetical protein
MVECKVRDIRERFGPVIGQAILHYETAELLLGDGSWSDWPDLPIRLYTEPGSLVAVSWSRFDDLWLANDTSLPFPTEGSDIRWVVDGIEAITPVIGKAIRSVMLGQGEMLVDGKPVEIWTRLLIRVDGGWLEVFNALDENGYAFHDEMPEGIFIPCLGTP